MYILGSIRNINHNLVECLDGQIEWKNRIVWIKRLPELLIDISVMFRDVREIPLLGEMSQSDKRVAVFAEKPSPTDIEEMFVLQS